MLDYDDLKKEDVKQDAETLTEKYPKLGKYRLEESKGGNWHVIWPLSRLKTMREAMLIAEQSRCDKDWLEICGRYGCFSLFPKDPISYNRKVEDTPQRKLPLLARGEVKGVTLKLYPETNIDNLRILKLLESFKDPDLTWKKALDLAEGRSLILVGCRDRRQAERRASWMKEKTEINFTHKIEIGR